MRIKAISLTILLLFAASAGYAQDHMSSITWGMAYPAQDSRDFIDNVSYRGFGIEGRRLVRTGGHLSVGLSFNWTVFNQETNEVISIANVDSTGINADISGSQRRYINAFPFMATAHFYFGSQDQPQFYIGGGVGAYYVKTQLDIGVFSRKEDTWLVGAIPEVGFIFPAGESSLIINAKYNYAIEADTIGGQKVDWAYFGVNIGFAYWAW